MDWESFTKIQILKIEKMKKVLIKRNVHGSVQEAFRQSYTYNIDAENASILGSAAGLIAIDAIRKPQGFEFMLRCEEHEAKEIVKRHNNVEVLFVP
jgi:hypothetical protein